VIDGWGERSIAELAEDVNVGHVGTSSDVRDESGVRFLMGKNVGPGYLKLEQVERVSFAFHRSQRKSQLSARDVVVVRIGNPGQAAMIPENFGEANCSGLVIVKGLSDIMPEFLVYFLNSPIGRARSLSNARGSTRQTLNTSTVAEMSVPVPPLAEQQRIVAKLDEVMTLGDLLQDRSDLERARSEELRQRMTVELMESSGPLSALGGLCEVLDSKRQPITKKDRAPGPIPYYGATGVVDYVRDFIFDEDLVLLGEDGAKWGPGDKSAFGISGRTWVNNHAHVLRPDRKVVRDQWLIEYLNAVDLRDYVTGLTVPKLNQAQMRSIPVPVPTLAVQDELLSRLDTVFELSGRLGEISATRKAKAGELRQSVLAAAFRGEL
jgi:restriction endonuclease S subunit